MWPSKVSTFSAFQDFIKKTFFKPSASVNMVVKVKSISTEQFPTQKCDACATIFEKSKILEAVNQVKWNLINTSTYELEKEVSQSLKPVAPA